MKNKFFSIEDAARMLGVSRRTIERYLRKGLRSTKIGREYFIRSEHLKSFKRPKKGQTKIDD
jgi:excisionase family DNA binding protein